jgi:hypothetical protein
VWLMHGASSAGWRQGLSACLSSSCLFGSLLASSGDSESGALAPQPSVPPGHGAVVLLPGAEAVKRSQRDLTLLRSQQGLEGGR